MGAIFGKKKVKIIDMATTCTEVLGKEEGGGKGGPGAFIIEQRRPIFQLYDVGKKIGQGSYACVYKGVNRSTEKKHAIKIVNKKNVDPDVISRLMVEIAVMKTLDHPYVNRIYETFEDEGGIYMVLEYCEGGDLFDR